MTISWDLSWTHHINIMIKKPDSVSPSSAGSETLSSQELSHLHHRGHHCHLDGKLHQKVFGPKNLQDICTISLTKSAAKVLPADYGWKVEEEFLPTSHLSVSILKVHFISNNVQLPHR